jgi:hypothetical protein
MAKKLVHLLVTVDINPGARLHSYVICQEKEEQRILGHVASRMFDEIEKLGIKPWPGIVLATKLDTGADVVHAVLDERAPEARSHFDSVKDFHLTMWAMASTDPCDAKLMELH